MSGNIIEINQGGEGEWKIPNDGEIYNANWRDDIVEEAEGEEKQLDFEAYDDESGYDYDKSETAKEPTEVGERQRELFRRLNQKRGARTLDALRLGLSLEKAA